MTSHHTRHFRNIQHDTDTIIVSVILPNPRYNWGQCKITIHILSRELLSKILQIMIFHKYNFFFHLTNIA